MLKKAPLIPYIPVADLQRARKFYEEKLGIEPGEEFAAGVIYRCGNDTTFFMYKSEGAGTSKASCAFWSVDDVEAEVAELKNKGVVFEEYDMPGLKMKNSIATGGGAKTAWFKAKATSWLLVSGSRSAALRTSLPASAGGGLMAVSLPVSFKRGRAK